MSNLSDLTQGGFQPIIKEIDELDAKRVTRLIICSGKVYYDLLQKRRELTIQHVAIVRLEQLYPFPEALFLDALASYPALQELVWCQEEPENQGAWFASQHHIRSCMGASQQFFYAGRPFAAAPAGGSAIFTCGATSCVGSDGVRNIKRG